MEKIIIPEEAKFEQIYCCGCIKIVYARLVSGAKIYPNRSDLHLLPFWICDQCLSYVGCHHKTKNPTKPLGNLPTPEIRIARQHIHRLIDPLWQNHPEKYRARGWIYRWLAAKMDYLNYHTAEIRTIEEARKIYALALTIKKPEDCRNV